MPLTRFPRFSSSGESTVKIVLLKLLLVLSFLNFWSTAFSQGPAETNSRIINRLVSEGLTGLLNKLAILGKDKLYNIRYDIKNPEAEYVARRVQSELQGFRIVMGDNSGKEDVSVDLKDTEIRVSYPDVFTDNIIGAKRVSRTVFVRFEAELSDSAGNKIESFSFRKSHKSKFDYEQLGMVQDLNEPFAYAETPDEIEGGDVLVPALMISISAAAIILFFTIRSK